MKYLLDTDHVSILQRQSGADFSALSAAIIRHPPADIVLSIVSFHEQIIGRHTYISRARNLRDLAHGYAMLLRTLHNYAAATVLTFDMPAAIIFDGLSAQGIRVATMDLRIASIALSLGLILLTRNSRDFGRVPNLVIEDWTKTSP